MKKKLSEIIGDANVFLDDLFGKINDIELNVDNYELDHICYRVESIDQYNQKKEELIHHGELLIESMVNGRMISTFKLHEPIVYKKRKISLVELPSPKQGHSYKSGLEHVEFVTKEPLQKIIDRYPQYSFEAFGIHKKINADITLKLGEHCIRFHNQSLEDVIKLEKKNHMKMRK
ncbi:MAG: VOC family protein [Bacteriovorax sp.]